MGESLDPSWIMTSRRRTTSGGLVVVGAMEIIVPLIAALAIDAIPIFATVLNSTVSILGMKNVLKVFSTLTLAVLQPEG
jgi:hypothetical protein